jgi:inosose dehydratase
MTACSSRFTFASAPDSWGVLDYPGPSWNQDYNQMLDEMIGAGYMGTELGPYGFFPTDPGVLGQELTKRAMTLLGSFVPVPLGNADSAPLVIEQIRKVGGLLSSLGAPFLVLADAQNEARDRVAGRVPSDGSAGFTPAQWRHVADVVAQAASVTSDFGLDLVFHPHISTYVETSEEMERFFDVTAGSGIGLCLDTGHSAYAGDDPVADAKKFREVLQFVHIKDIDAGVIDRVRRSTMNFEEAIEAKAFTIIGQGSINFPAFFETLVSLNYQGWLVVEQDVKFGATDIPPRESIAASLRYLETVVEGVPLSSAPGIRAM